MEQIFIIEDGTLTKYETDDYVEEVYMPDCVKRISFIRGWIRSRSDVPS